MFRTYLSRTKALALAAVAAVLVIASDASAQVTLPDTGIDLEAYIEEMFASFGSYFALLVGFVMAYFAINLGIKVIKKLSNKAA